MGYYAFDFDGTIAMHLSGGGVSGCGRPIESMILRLKALLAKGDEVRIITARIRVFGPDNPNGAHVAIWNQQQTQLIHQFLMAQGIKPLTVQAHKCFQMIMLYDDRCIQIETNTGVILGREPADLAEYLGVMPPVDRRSANQG